jgi:hypothetical protein
MNFGSEAIGAQILAMRGVDERRSRHELESPSTPCGARASPCRSSSAIRAPTPRASVGSAAAGGPVTRRLVAGNLHRAFHQWKRATDSVSWGGVVGLTWMVAYWATLIPLWVHQVVQVASTR